MEDNEQDQPEQQCEECLKVFPMTPRYFPAAKGCTFKRQRVCRKCKKELAKRAKLDKIEAAAVESFCSRTISGGANIPHTAELTESLMNYFGGVNGFASICMKQYWDAKPGSRIRSGVLEMVVRLATKNTEAGGAKKPIDLYSEEELEAEINKRIENVILLNQGKMINVIPQAPTAASAGLPSPEHQLIVGLSDRRTQELADRAFGTPDGVLEALFPNSQAMGLSPGSDQ